MYAVERGNPYIGVRGYVPGEKGQYGVVGVQSQTGNVFSQTVDVVRGEEGGELEELVREYQPSRHGEPGEREGREGGREGWRGGGRDGGREGGREGGRGGRLSIYTKY